MTAQQLKNSILQMAVQDRLFQDFGECGVEGGELFFCLAVSFDVWEEFFYLGYYAVLFGEGWDRNKVSFKFVKTCSYPCNAMRFCTNLI